jgi:NADH dehydrogenase [ubiquinone] 1 alpha subcomplex assembly factor 7
LHHEKYGYYQQKKEKIGAGGDFITSPEITQLFGEMVGIWCLATWENMGRPPVINLVELGPGNGTLMRDVLNIVTKFPEFQSALQVIIIIILIPS